MTLPESLAPEAPNVEGPRPEPVPAAPRRHGFLRRFFLLEERIAEARRLQFGPNDPGHAEYERARELQEAVGALMAPREPLRLSDGTRAAMRLAREAAYFAARAHLARAGREVDERGPREIVEAFRELPVAERVERALGAPISNEAFGDLFAPPPLFAPPVGKAELASLRELVSRMLEPIEEELRGELLLRVKRALRIGAAALVLGLALVASMAGLRAWMRGPNLALNCATSASSAYGNQTTTSGVVDGNKRVHGFHTGEDTNPWLKLDLGEPKKIGRVVVYNRTDCCEDRAAPLVVEVSVDGEAWTTVARREKKFAKWEASFAETEARWVRFTVEKTTWLHFNEVEIYGG